MWLETNLLFFGAFADLIHEHNELIRKKEIEEYIESEDESDDKSEDERFQKSYIYAMSDNKLVTSILDAATITGHVAGIGWIGKNQSKKTSQPTPVQIS